MKTLIGLLLAFAASAAGAADTPSPPQSFESEAAAISQQMRVHHFDPNIGSDAAYLAVESEVQALAAKAQTREDFVASFNAIWRDGPFSHVNLVVAQGSAAQMAEHLDQMQVGGGGARLSWQGDVAVLTVSTMMGSDTIAEIDAAYAEISAKPAAALIIDLRENGGGAFAVVPLIGHLITQAFDAGAFVSRDWRASGASVPSRADVLELAPWTGWSVKRFWEDVATQPLTRIQFQPMAPNYDGPVYVLTSARTASAAEMAADALRASGRATLIGETTAGQMLSQKPFDLPGGMQLFLPIADYYSFSGGHIEGTGVRPDMVTPAADALEIAFAKAASQRK